MNKISKAALAIAVVSAAAQASAQVTFYENQGFQGRTFSTTKNIDDLGRDGFYDRASSVAVTSERWEVCEDARLRGRCVVLRPGKYRTLSAMGLNDRITSVRAVKSKERIDDRRYAPAPNPAQITFYENESFGGRSFTTDTLVENFRSKGFNDRVSSVMVTGPDQWEACEDVRFNGRCVILRPGRYPSLRGTGLNDRISSVRNSATTAATPAPAQITFYENESFGGRSFTTDTLVENLRSEGFNDRVSSVTVTGPDQWEVCEDARFNGRCVVLRPGQYPSLRGTALNDRISSVRNTSAKAPAPASAQVTIFENSNFSGRSFSSKAAVDNLTTYGFNDRASSVLVAGDSRWEVCDESRFNGRCMVLRPGQYTTLAAMGLNNRISSVREVSRDARIDDWRYAPAPIAAPDYRQRQNERLYEVNVNSVRAVVGTPEKRCWVERAQVPQDQSNANIPGAVVGALLGGVLGHQVGGGTGKDIATAGGVIAGAVLGSRVGGNAGTPEAAGQDVQRCEETPSQARTEYWDVTYSFKGQDHRIQMTTPPGRTITVNEQGEPRN
jgi:uncharacterized protein YcfJ/uncharacterized protein (UPF0179 family)